MVVVVGVSIYLELANGRQLVLYRWNFVCLTTAVHARLATNMIFEVLGENKKYRINGERVPGVLVGPILIKAIFSGTKSPPIEGRCALAHWTDTGTAHVYSHDNAGPYFKPICMKNAI
jgi:hypothetical protein